MNNPGFDRLKQAFNATLKGKYDPKDLGRKAKKSFAAAGKAFIDETKKEFPQESIEQFISDIYGFIGSPDVAEGISMSVQSLSADDLQDFFDKVTSTLASDEVANALAQQIKSITAQMPFEDFISQMEALMGNVPPMQQMMINMVLGQIEPFYNQLDDASVEDIADMLKEGVKNIPTDMFSYQLEALTQAVTPEQVSTYILQATSSLPAPKTVSDIAYGVADAASKQLDRIADPDTTSTPASVKEFADDIQSVVEKSIANDNKNKKAPPKDGFKFKF